MAVTYAHGRTHATVAFSGALDWAGAGELVDVVDMLVGHYFYARLELASTSGGGDTDALEQVLGAMGRWERTGVRLCTVATVEAGRVVVAHVGDSRLYDLEPRAGVLHQRTSDHNLRNELRARGRSLQEAVEEGLPLAGLVSYVGMPDDELRVDVFSWSPGPGTRLLLCSDGVHGSLGHGEIAEVLSTFTARRAATELTQRADAAGGRDNSTAVVVELS